MTGEGESAALELARSLEQADPDDELLDLSSHYPEELAVPEVARLHQLFSGLDTLSIHRATRPPGDSRFTYGETPAPVLYRLLRRWAVGPQDVFYDLGCGCGLAAFTAALMARRVVGVDLVPGAVEFARRSAPLIGAKNVEFRVGDFLETDLKPATWVYSATTAFPANLRSQLFEHLRSCRKGARLLTVTFPVKARGIRLVTRVPMFFSWSGRGTGWPFEFYFHVRE